jgi:hypothetical protein
MLFEKKPVQCCVCKKTLEDKCGFAYKMRVKRYTPDGYFCLMKKKGAVCEQCLIVARDMVRERIAAKEVKIS